jgi:protein-disulfide isomerase
MPQLERDYVATGRLQIAYRYLPLDSHPHAPTAARAAECANQQGQFWSMHDRLFNVGTKFDDQSLQVIATSLDLDEATYNRCVSAEASKAAVSRDKEEAKSLGLQSTPAFLLGLRAGDGRIQVSKVFFGAAPVERFRSEIDRVIRRTKGGVLSFLRR